MGGTDINSFFIDTPAAGAGMPRMGLIDGETWQRAKREPNVLERDVMLKHAMGFDDAQLTRMHHLLNG